MTASSWSAPTNPVSIRARAELELRRRRGVTTWPREYKNNKSGKVYQPHNEEERLFVYSDEPRNPLLRGGWGSGKSSAGVIKLLERQRRGMDSIMVSPDYPHFKKSLWPAFREWCPWSQVVEKHRHYQYPENLPPGAGAVVFTNGTTVYFGGISDATSWYGGNVHFALFDEASRCDDDSALKSLQSRARLTGPNGEPPQVAITTTPDMNWLYDYYGEVKGEDDQLAEFKRFARVSTIVTEENMANLDPGYLDTQRRTLTPDEFALYMRAEWVRVASSTKFIELLWWDACQEQLPPLRTDEVLVLGVDAATGGETSTADCFAVVGVTRHPHRMQDVAVRYCGIWQPPPGGLLDFLPIEEEIRRLCKTFAVVEIAYDKTQLHDMMMRLARESVAFTKEFSQAGDRLEADKRLQDMILARRIAHDGNPLLRRHVDNANVRKTPDGAIRIVKRAETLKVDGCVSLSQATDRCMYYNLNY